MDITNLSQIASPSDRLTSDWINAARSAILTLQSQLALANETIAQLKAATTQAFQASVVSGLNISYSGGSVGLTSGIIVAVPPGNKTVPNNATSYRYVDDAGAVILGSNLPIGAVGIARIVAANNVISSLEQYPLFAIRPSIDPGQYATIAYAASRAWEKVAVARKTAVQALSGLGAYSTITFQELSGVGFATSGVFTHTGSPRDYIFDAQIRMDTTAPNTSDLSVKVSLFVNNSVEEAILFQSRSAEGDITGTGRNVEPLRLNDGDRVAVKSYITSGVQVRVRENYSVCTAWRLPEQA